MSSAIKNAGDRQWTYYNKFTDTSTHDLPANWNELYITSVTNSVMPFPLFVRKEALESGGNTFCSNTTSGSNNVQKININRTNNTITMTAMNTSWVKIYYR